MIVEKGLRWMTMLVLPLQEALQAARTGVFSWSTSSLTLLSSVWSLTLLFDDMALPTNAITQR